MGVRRLLIGVVSASLVLTSSTPASGIYDAQTSLADGATFNSTFAIPNVSTQISPDGRFAVIRADLDTANRFELYSVRLDDSDAVPVKLSTIDASSGDVYDFFQIAPDSSRVVYRGTLLTNGVIELFSAPLDAAGQQVRLNDDPDPAGDVQGGFRIAPDSSRVVYRGDLDTDARTELYSAPLDAPGGQTTLSSIEHADGDVSAAVVQFTPDSTRVVYTGDLLDEAVTELFSAPIAAANGQMHLNDTPEAGDVNSTFRVTPDSTRVVYTGDLLGDETDTTNHLFSAPVDAAGGQVRLNADPVPKGEVHEVFLLAPDGSRVVYRGDLLDDEVRELFSAPVDRAGGQVRLNTEPTVGDIRPGFRVAPDSSRVVYVGDLLVDGVDELFSAPIASDGGQVRLSDTPVDGGDVSDVEIAPDSSRVVYRGDLLDNDVLELFSAPLGRADEQIRLNSLPTTDGGLVDTAYTDLVIAPDGSRVVYRGDLRDDEVFELFSAPLDVAGQQTTVNTAPVDGGDVSPFFAFAPDSSFVVYAGDLDTDESFGAFASGVGQFPARAVTDVATSDVGSDRATVEWTPPAFGSQVTSYEVRVRPTDARRRVDVDGGVTSTTFTDLDPATTYDVTVVARNDAGDSPAATVEFTTEPLPEPEPEPEPEPQPEPEPAGVVRLAGDDRYATPADVALERFDPDDVDTVLIATGTNFPDALAGGPLATTLGAPILLVEPGALPDATRTALTTLDPDTVIALGGTLAVTDDVLTAAGTAAGAATDRIAGDNREATATAIADALIAAGGDPTRAYLAIGTNFPDAVAAGPATAGAPILLTPGTTLATATATWLRTNTPDTLVAVGGDAVLQPPVLTAAATAAGNATTTRLAGNDRYATGTAIATTLDTPDTVYVAVGTNFPDALTGGPAAATERAPVVLVAGGTDIIPDATLEYLRALPDLRRIVLIGGDAVITPAVADQLAQLLD